MSEYDDRRGGGGQYYGGRGRAGTSQPAGYPISGRSGDDGYGDRGGALVEARGEAEYAYYRPGRVHHPDDGYGGYHPPRDDARGYPDDGYGGPNGGGRSRGRGWEADAYPGGPDRPHVAPRGPPARDADYERYDERRPVKRARQTIDRPGGGYGAPGMPPSYQDDYGYPIRDRRYPDDYPPAPVEARSRGGPPPVSSYGNHGYDDDYGYPPARRGGGGGGGDGRDRYFSDDSYRGGGDSYRGERAGYDDDAYRGGGGGQAAYGRENEQEAVRMSVPPEVARMVIGTGGAAIRELQERTGAHVVIFKPKTGADEHGPRPVLIKGSRRAVSAAAAELQRAVGEYEAGGRVHVHGGHGGDRGPSHPPRPGDPSDPRRGHRPDDGFGGRGGGGVNDEIIEDQLKCPPESVGMIIGKGGQRVKRLEEETGCRVKHDAESSYLVLRGTRRAIASAKSQIAAILSVQNLPAMPPAPAPGEAPAAEVPVPQDAIGKVMGFSGSNIKRIQAETQCKMNWDKRLGVMQLWGSPEAVNAGRRRLEQDIEEAQNEKRRDDAGGYPDATPGGGHSGHGGFGGGDAVAEVAARGQAGFLIGRGGDNIRRMEAESGARLDMDSETQVMRITGSQPAVDTAKRLVEECIARGIRRKEEMGGGGDGGGFDVRDNRDDGGRGRDGYNDDEYAARPGAY